MKYFVVFVALIAFQFVSASPSAEPLPGLLDGLGGVIGGVVDLVGNLLQILVSALSGLLSNDESNSVDQAAAATAKEFDDIIRAARKIDYAVTRYNLDDAIKAVKKIAEQLVRILASINDETLAKYSDDISANLKAGLKSLIEKVRVVEQIAVEKLRPILSAEDNIALNNVLNSVRQAANKVANPVEVRIFTLEIYDLYKNNLTEDVSNIDVDKAAIVKRYASYVDISTIAPDAYEALTDVFSVSYNVASFFATLTEIMLTNDQQLILQTLEGAITSTVDAVRAILSKLMEIRPNVNAEDYTALDRNVDSLVATSAAVVNNIQSYINVIANYDISKDTSLFPKLYKKEYILKLETEKWDDALMNCAGNGWELATIDYQAENDELVNQIETEAPISPFWLSGTDVSYGSWNWYVTAQPLTFTNWQPGYPHASGRCLLMDVDRRWIDDNCDNLQRYVCQRYVEI